MATSSLIGMFHKPEGCRPFRAKAHTFRSVSMLCGASFMNFNVTKA